MLRDFFLINMLCDPFVVYAFLAFSLFTEHVVLTKSRRRSNRTTAKSCPRAILVKRIKPSPRVTVK